MNRLAHASLFLPAATLCGALMIAPCAFGATYRVVDTNQTKCYGTGTSGKMWSCPDKGDKLFGQDANYVINPPRYHDNGDDTVSDLVTGLMWQKGFESDVPFAQAPDYARQANTGGYTDWRVPSVKELYSLMDFSGHQGSGDPSSSKAPRDAVPFIETDVFDFEFPTNGRYIDAQYVTTSAYRGVAMGNAAFFGVNLADGRIKGYPQAGNPHRSGWYARFVRGNADYGRNAFRDNGNGTISDTATGLSWMRGDSGGRGFSGKLGQTHYKDGRMDWPEALKFCEKLDFAGAKDWRLPNAKELHSILDYSRSPQSTGTAALDPIFGVSSITDEKNQPNFPGYWSSTTLLAGRTPGSDAVVVYFGEALGAPSQMPPSMGSQGGGRNQQGQGFRPGQQGQGMGMPPGRMPGQGFRPGMGRPGMGRPGMGGPGLQGGGQMQGRPQQGQQRMGQQGMGKRGGQGGGTIMDVHGAGAQRSDPKTGDAGKYPSWGHGPQGDVRRVYNHVRCVRTSA